MSREFAIFSLDVKRVEARFSLSKWLGVKDRLRHSVRNME